MTNKDYADALHQTLWLWADKHCREVEKYGLEPDRS